MYRSIALALVTLVALPLLALTVGFPSALADGAETADEEPLLASAQEASLSHAGADLTELDPTIALSGSSCSASLDCGDGNVVSCTGSTSCSRTIAGVICDGVENRCPNFCSLSLNCGPCGIATCWSTAGNCTRNPDACDGRLLQCRCPR